MGTGSPGLGRMPRVAPPCSAALSCQDPVHSDPKGQSLTLASGKGP